jgi:amino acid adenylation domain-containing protein
MSDPMPPHDRLAGLSREQRALLFEQIRRRKGKEKDRPAAPAPLTSRTAPLSFAQERLWFLDLLEPGNPAFNMGSALRLRGWLDTRALERALNEIVRRHEILRTSFREVDGSPVQWIAPGLWTPLPVVDLASLPEAVREPAAVRVAQVSVTARFELATGPLIRASLLRLAPDRHLFLLDVHHIVSDGWSVGVMNRELISLYEAFSAGRPSPLPPLPTQYGDFARWQREWLRGETLEAQLSYWRGKLGGVLAPLDLPADRPRPPIQTFRGGNLQLRIPAATVSALRRLSREARASLFMTLLAAFQALLSRLSGQDDVVVGSPVAGRHRAETEPLIGFFLNNLALRTDLAGNPSFRDLLLQVRETTLGAFAHQDIPFEALLVDLKPERDLSRTPVFQVFFNMLNFPSERGSLPALEIEAGPAAEPEAKFDFTLYATDSEEEILLLLVYNADLFDAPRMEELLRQYRLILAAVARDPGCRVEDLSLTTPEGAAVLPDLFRPLTAGWPGAVHDRFLARARRHPGRRAAADVQGAWTWGDLDAASGRLATQLLAAGLGPAGPVAVWAHRAVPLAAALLGVLRAGGAFVILDPAYPPARLAGAVSRVRPRAWVEIPGAGPVPAEVASALGGVPRLRVAGPGLPVDPGAPCAAVHPDAAAWIAFTSGSTGEPKGIVGSHRPLSHFLEWHERTFGLGDGDRFSLLSGLAHDPLLRDVFTPIWVGGELRVPPPEPMGEPGWLAGWFAREAITVAHLTPAMARLLASGETEPLTALRLVCSGGDVLTGDAAARLRRTAPGARLVNFYGATETPQAMGWKAVEEPRPRISLGRGIDGVDLLVLGRSGRPAGIGELGEISIRTPYLALGYLDNPAGTAERFAPAPGDAAGTRLYRTGDLGRYEPDGDVVYAGRADRQVKIRGFRVEPAEIEAAIGRLEEVRGAVVVALEEDGETVLAAYVVPAPGAAPGLTTRLRPLLAAHLPAGMIPAFFIELPALPLTPNGKVDRRALPAPGWQSAETGPAPRNPVEEVLAGLWAELLRRDRVGVHDDFFDLGGHSLLATQLVSRVRTVFGVELSLRQLFDNPTLERLAKVVASRNAASSAGVAIPPRPPRLDPVPASFAQERLWFLDRLAPGNRAYHIAKALRLVGGVSPAALEAVFGEVVRRHEALRTTFAERDGQPVQVIAPPGLWRLPTVDLSGLPEGAAVAEAGRLAQEEAARPFDLERGPLLRASLLALGKADYGLLLTMHHIVSDGWSMGVLVQEVSALYAAAVAGRPAALPPLAIQYADFAVWQRAWLQGERLEQQLAYWRERLAGAPDSPALPTDRTRSAEPDPRGARVRLSFGPERTREILALARRRDATLFMTLFAAFHALLARTTGEDDLVLGSAIANRVRAEIEPLIGFFVNAFALRAGLPGDPSFLDLLASVRRATLEAYAHQDLPFERLVEALRPGRHLSRNPLFQVSLGLHNMPEARIDAFPGVTLLPLELEAPSPVFDLEVHFMESAGQLFAEIGYRADLFDGATIRRLAAHLERLLAGVVEDPERRLSALPLFAEAERHQLLREWNDTRVETDGAFRDIAARIEEQARRSPGALALAFQGREITYAELDAQAGRLAGRLAALGVGPESLVGLHVERSPEMVIGALAILKAGGAYVPLDPSYPDHRLARVAAETRMPVVVTRGGDPGWAGPAVQVRVNEEPAGDPRGLARPSAVAPETTAYVIYTSGSTGRPKGVPISRAGLLNMIDWHTRTYRLTADDRVAQVMAMGFDAAVGEIWPALAAGASLHIADEETRLSAAGLLAWMAAEKIDLAILPTVLAEPVLERAERQIPSGLALRTLLVGGDRLKRFPSPSLPFRVANNYGPTESAMVAAWSVLESGETDPHRLPPIGRPIDNARLYVLDRFLRPVPAGTPGELAIGGAGLSRGYSGRPDLAAESFVPDPFSVLPGGRLYRSGDRVRRRLDGRLDFLERLDRQVKIRGFRIELGEIERVLELHPAVSEAVVTTRGEGEAAGPRLVAYVTRREEGEPASRAGEDLDHVDQWQTLYDDTYGEAAGAPDGADDPVFDIRGWNSSYTGEPIPAGEMREWVERTVERILSLRPRRVLEIGCGTGLLLFRVAPRADLYLGTDFSSLTLDGIRRQLAASEGGGPRVELRQAMAHEAAGIVPAGGEGFDLVVLNSVVQYFPGVDYLARVLEGAVRSVAPGGAVFLGDLRSLPLLQAFHASVELFQAPDTMPAAELRRRIGHRLANEEELAVDPRLFLALAQRLPAIRGVEVLVKRGSAHNELTRFRYDVVLRVGATPAAPAGRRVDGQDRGLTLAGVERLLAGEPGALELTGLANARLATEAAALDLLAEAGAEVATLAGLRREIAARITPGIDPEALWELGDRHGFDVELRVDAASPFRFDASLRRRGSAPASIPVGTVPEVSDLPWSAFGNDPLGAKHARRLTSELRRFLRAELPEYMIPASFVLLDHLPLNRHGKVDRAALPEPEPMRLAATAAPPRTPVERALALLWREVLGVAEVGREDGFFELGGHSLLATQLVSRVRDAFAVELPLRAVFETPTLSGVASWIEQARSISRPSAGAPPLRPVSHEGPLPLSFAQERLWFLDRLRPGDPTYNMPTALRALGELSPPLLEATLGEVVRRHEALRTTFQLRGGKPAQVIAPPWRWILPQVDLSGLPERLGLAEALRLAQEEAVRPFDLERGPLLRASLLRLEPAEHVLLLAMHHIVSDGWSMGVLVREITAIYRAAAAGRPSPLPELPLQYADFAVWQRRWLAGDELERQLGYWRGHLAGAPASLNLPFDRLRPATPAHHGGRVSALLDPDLSRELGRFALGREATLFMVLLSGFQALLSRLTGQQDVLVGSPIANRNRAEIEPLIGFFVNTLVLRGDLAGDPPFRELLTRTRGTTLEAYAHQDLPFEQLVEALRPQRTLAMNPLFQVLFALQNQPAEAVELPGLSLSSVEFKKDMSRFDLELGVWEMGGSILLDLVYSAELFDRPTLERAVISFETLLRGALAGEGRRLSELPLLPEAARHQIVTEWNDTRPAREPRIAVERFAAQVAAAPDGVALEAGGERLTYAELDRRANRLAHRLRRLGVGPDVVVGLFADRATAMVAGILGIWKAGGAYLPLDPGQPRERLADLLEDSRVPVIAAGAGLVQALPSSDARVVQLDDESLAAESDLPPAGGSRPGDLAALIYTSGTTGRPKAVLVEHGNLASTLAAAQEAFAFGPEDRVASIASFAFDIFLLELLDPLFAGGTCVLLPTRPTLDLEGLVEELGSATVLHGVPAVMRQVLTLARLRGATAPRLRALFLGGDGVPADLLNDLRETFPGVAVWVLYGPTEAAIVCTLWRMPAEGPVRSLLGRPFAGAEIRLCDAGGRPVPVGVPGEIWIGGAVVARGYWRREELTAEKFVVVDGRRFYRSGDLARRLPDGTLEFLGRLDHQVKIRGFRIELGEIEAALAGQPGVQEAVVLARDEGGGGERRLVAYVVAGPEGVPLAGLRASLARRLPAYMLPAAFVFLDALPLDASGKIDRRAFPAPELAGSAAGPVVPPRTPLERFLAGRFREVLGLPADREIGVDDDFFELGGTSITGAVFVYRLQEALSEAVHVVAIFDQPTVASLAEYIRERHAGAARRIWGEGTAEATGPGPAGIPTGRSVLVPLQAGSPGRRPLFCVHPVGGEVVAYRELARHLGTRQPVYGLQSPEPPLADVREMAGRYAAAVRGVQPEGPYRIAGWSMGGIVAYEMARRLQMLGERVEILALIDSVSPARWAGEPEPGESGMVVALFASDLARLHGFAIPDVNVSNLDADGALTLLLDLGRRAGLLPPSLEFGELRRLFDRFRAHRRALATYEPPPYDGPVHLFRAAGRISRMEEDDLTLGWGGLVNGELRVSDLPGDHYSILREEVEALAGRLRALLERGEGTGREIV